MSPLGLCSLTAWMIVTEVVDLHHSASGCLLSAPSKLGKREDRQCRFLHDLAWDSVSLEAATRSEQLLDSIYF